jgi:hypothetical protein
MAEILRHPAALLPLSEVAEVFAKVAAEHGRASAACPLQAIVFATRLAADLPLPAAAVARWRDTLFRKIVAPSGDGGTADVLAFSRVDLPQGRVISHEFRRSVK